MSFPSRIIGYGSGRGGDILRMPLIRWCDHALYDFRRNQHRDTGATEKNMYFLGGAQNGLQWGASNQNNWYGDSTGAFATISTSQRFNITTNIADAQAEAFCIARIKMSAGGFADPFCRGRDGSGSGWSILGAHGLSGGQMNAITTSGGAAARSTSYSKVFEPDVWHTVHYAYKSGAYVRCGDSGIWRSELTFSATGLRNSSVGLGINRHNSFDATANCYYRFYGIGTAIPPDLELLNLHEAILEAERVYDTPGGVLLTSAGGGGGGSSYIINPVTIFG
jgi:hypothetical protein